MRHQQQDPTPEQIKRLCDQIKAKHLKQSGATLEPLERYEDRSERHRDSHER